jgi:hypothetical protein
VTATVHAADGSWRGSGTGGNTNTSAANPTTQWSNAANWQTLAAPTDSDQAIINFQNAGAVYASTYHVEDLTASGTSGFLKLDGTSFNVDDFLSMLGTARIVQTAGVHNIGRALKIGGSTGAGDAYRLEGGELRIGFSVPWWEADVEIGRGGFTQTGGLHDAAHDLWVWSSLTDGGYRLINGQLKVDYELSVYGSSFATFRQSGGQLDVGTKLSVATVNSTLGRFELSGGIVNSNEVQLGTGGAATVVQSNGTFNVPKTLRMAYFAQSSGYYELSGGTLNVNDFILAREGSGTVMQSGGVATIANQMIFSERATANTRYELVDGELNAHHVLLGGLGTERIIQRGGQFSADVLAITDNAVYEYQGGEFDVLAGLDVEGTINFTSHPATLDFGADHVVDLSGTIQNAAQTSWNIGPNSLTILRAGFNPATAFASYTNTGHVMITGNRFVLPAGQSIRGGGDLDEFLEVHGLVEATAGNALDPHGLFIANGGIVNLGAGQALLDRSGSGIDGGELRARRMVLRTPFAHTAGNVVLEQDLELRNTYTLSAGRLSAQSSNHYGTFQQSGGQVSYSSNLYISAGSYTLADGTLTTGQTGLWSSTIFNQTGGTHQTGWLRTITRGAYNISGGHFIAGMIGVGEDAGGSVSISGSALVEVSDRIRFGQSGQLNLTGGTLRARSIEVNTARFNVFSWTGGRIELQNAIGPITNNGGVLAPTNIAAGEPISTLAFTGDYTQLAGQLEMQLAGTEKGAQYDHFQLTGAANLGGMLTVLLASGFVPQIGDSFELIEGAAINGTFSSLNLPAIDPGEMWQLNYGLNTVVLSLLTAGDSNGDGTVNAADYILWRRNDGTPAGYNTWRANFGRTAVTGTLTDVAAPEPASACTMMIGTLAIMLRARLRPKRRQ